MKHSLKRSLLTITVLFLCALSVALAYMGYSIYRSDMLARYQNYAGDAINCLARCVDGDDLEACIESGVKSARCEQLQRLANDFKETHDLIYIYIVKPLKVDPPGNIMDVLAAYTQWEKENEPDTLTDLGVITEYSYPSEVAAEYMARMEQDVTVTYFRNDTDFGDIYTAIRPILNSQGEPVAVICGDIMIDEIFTASRKYAVTAAALTAVSALVVALLLNRWYSRRVVNPISRLMHAAEQFEEKCHRRADVSLLVMDDPSIHTGDEIEALSDSVVHMVADVQEYARALLEKDSEILSMKEYVSKMDVLAYQDALTGAGNKAAYEKAVRRLDWDILAGNTGFGILMADLNYLKRINDSYGHDRGNEYLMGMYRILSEVFTQSPIFRIGGDEFVVLLQNEEFEQRDIYLQRVRQRMRQAMEDSSLDPWQRISAAFGCAVPEEGEDVAAVFRRADEAMYADKKRMRAQR